MLKKDVAPSPTPADKTPVAEPKKVEPLAKKPLAKSEEGGMSPDLMTDLISHIQDQLKDKDYAPISDYDLKSFLLRNDYKKINDIDKLADALGIKKKKSSIKDEDRGEQIDFTKLDDIMKKQKLKELEQEQEEEDDYKIDDDDDDDDDDYRDYDEDEDEDFVRRKGGRYNDDEDE